MDRVIEPRRFTPGRWAAAGAATLSCAWLAWQLVIRAGTTRLAVDPQRLTTAVVRESTFLEYYPVDGTVEPATSVYLDVEQGGRVEAILAEAGQQVREGDLIVRFSNPSLQRMAIDTETQLLYNLDIQRSTQFARAEAQLVLKESAADLDHALLDAQRLFTRYDALMKSGDSPISRETYEAARDNLDYLRRKQALLTERIHEEDVLSSRQLAQTQRSIGRLDTSMQLLNRIVHSLEVRAPIAGVLSTIDAQIGQSIAAGQRIGQIDRLDALKLQLSIDQYYIGRVAPGTGGRVEVDGHSWPVQVTKVYPEVKNSTFRADAVFAGGAPGSLKRGQTLTVDLTSGSPGRALVVAKGGFYQQTQGRWVYLLAADGRRAHRAAVRLGRQNPREVEVLEGLAAGDRIITSGYDTFNGADELDFSAPAGTQRDQP
jgi:HlyD family secretion protein